MIRNQTLFRNIKPIILWTIIIFLVAIYIYDYNQAYNVGHSINYSFDGIKYQSNNTDSGTPIKLIINGVYKKEFGTRNYIFEGDIIVDNELCYASSNGSNIYAFNDYRMSSIENSRFKGDFFASDSMNEITIVISVPRQDGGRTFSYKDGWLISAPSNTRSEAIEISNRLIHPFHERINIK